jgi:uncharacterized protein YggE
MKRIFSTLALLTIITYAQAQNHEHTPPQRTINVSGTSEMEIVPDEIYVQVDLREYDKKGVGKVDIESIKTKFIKAATGVGISDTNITIHSYQGFDGNYWWYRKNSKKNPDMKASISYWLKLPNTKKMDQLVEKLDDEATQNFFIAKVAHSKEKEFKKQLKMEAVKAAKEKAMYLAAAIGENIGAAMSINEPGEMQIYNPRVYASAANMAMKEQAMDGNTAASSPDIDFKKIKYRFEVHTVFALK